MEQKDFEKRLDEYADRISSAVGDGVKKVEQAFEKGKENLRQDAAEREEGERPSGSPRTGIVLIALGVAWLLFTMGVFRQPIFPILLIILGIYFVVRSR